MELLIFPVLLGVMYFAMIRPQQKRATEHREILASLEAGDEVVTAAGFYGVITDFDGPTVFLEIADGVEMKVTRESVTGVVKYDDESAADDESANDDESAADDVSEHSGPIT